MVQEPRDRGVEVPEQRRRSPSSKVEVPEPLNRSSGAEIPEPEQRRWSSKTEAVETKPEQRSREARYSEPRPETLVKTSGFLPRPFPECMGQGISLSVSGSRSQPLKVKGFGAEQLQKLSSAPSPESEPLQRQIRSR